VLNVISGLIVIGKLFAGAWIYWIYNVMQLCILVSCGFLIDAFRLLSKLKSSEQSISKKQAAILSFAFGAFGASSLIKDLS
jgi:hypothetical protein